VSVGTAVSDRGDVEDVIAVMMAALDALQRATLALSAALGGQPGEPRVDGEPGRAHRADLAALTSREVEVALLVGSGHSNQQIARRLCVSVRTVEAHLSHIYRKLRVESRLALCRLVAADTYVGSRIDRPATANTP